LKKTAMILSLLAALLVTHHFLLPRVWYRPSPYGTELARSALLPDTLTKRLAAYVRDTTQYAPSQQVVIIHNERILFEEGDTRQLINCHSARKSIMNLLIGIAREKGFLRLDETLAQVGIDESKTPLTPQEKSATIRDLLMARSGVYLPAEAETDFAKANRPKRGQYKPGEFYFYNNFDFNVLGAILEKKTLLSIGEFMETYLAKPLGLQDFSAANVVYGNPWPIRDDQSDFRVYWMYVSARDLARIGALVAQQGRWNNKQLVSPEWIAESTKPYSTTLDNSMWPFDGYGYLWWIDKDANTIWADGYGGQFLLIDPQRNLVVSQQNFTGKSLLTSGLFLIRKQKRHGGRYQAMHLHELVKNFLDQQVIGAAAR